MSVSSINSMDTTYSIVVDEYSPTIMYIGEASIGSSEGAPVWRIKQLETSGTQLKIKWADGNQAFDNIWSNRASLTYL